MKPGSKAGRVWKLSMAWLNHTHSAPLHEKAHSEGGTATHDMNGSATYITCCSCGWEMRLNTLEER